MAKYELLVKRDQDMTAFIDSFDATRAGIIAEQQSVQYVIVALLESISKVRQRYVMIVDGNVIL